MSNSDNWMILTRQTVEEWMEKLQEEKQVRYKVVGIDGVASLKDIVIQDTQKEFRFKCKNFWHSSH